MTIQQRLSNTATAESSPPHPSVVASASAALKCAEEAATTLARAARAGGSAGSYPLAWLRVAFFRIPKRLVVIFFRGTPRRFFPV